MATMFQPTTITRLLAPSWTGWLPGIVWVLDGERVDADEISDGLGVDWCIIDESEFDDDEDD
jgi:hypothetical protein